MEWASMPHMKIGSLFSGIGGLELGLERADVGSVVWQVEIDPFCRKVLARHWPQVTRYEDIQTCIHLPPVDVICGGFPCQDVSSAGKRAGLAGAKSGLWREFFRIVGELRPLAVIVENVASGKKLWLPTVRTDLESLGYRVRAFTLSAEDVGAPHLRRRVFIVANPTGFSSGIIERQTGKASISNGHGQRLEKWCEQPTSKELQAIEGDNISGDPWSTESGICGMAYGIPHRVDRVRALGNAVVPQCAEVIGRILLDILNA